MEDREAEEVLLRPPTQRATANTKQCLLKVNPLFLFLYNEMKSTSNEPEGAGQADCALLKEVEKQ